MWRRTRGRCQDPGAGGQQPNFIEQGLYGCRDIESFGLVGNKVISKDGLFPEHLDILTYYGEPE